MLKYAQTVTVSALATAASNPDWQCLDDIDSPLCQGSLSLAIDQAVYQRLLSSAPYTRFRALALSSGLSHARDWLNEFLLLLWNYISKIKNFDVACAIG